MGCRIDPWKNSGILCSVSTSPLRVLSFTPIRVTRTACARLHPATQQLEHHLTTGTLFGCGISLNTSPQFLPQGFIQDNLLYKPPVHLLNMTIRVTNESLHAPTGVILRKVPTRCYLSRLVVLVFLTSCQLEGRPPCHRSQQPN